MSNAAQCTKNAITLKGSAQIIANYLSKYQRAFNLKHVAHQKLFICLCLPSEYGVNSILFQRGIYPPEDFQSQQQYGLTILMSTNNKICEFIEQVLRQAEKWMARNELDKVSLIITNVHTKETLECWDFKVQPDPEASSGTSDTILPDGSVGPTSNKELKRIQQEIGSVMRQISATVSYLPLIDGICSFDIHIHTLKDCDVPEKWDETNAVYIQNSQVVQLRSFSTGVQKVETVVNYKMN